MFVIFQKDCLLKIKRLPYELRHTFVRPGSGVHSYEEWMWKGSNWSFIQQRYPTPFTICHIYDVVIFTERYVTYTKQGVSSL